MDLTIDATPRGAQGTGASRRLRRTGRVPGVLYGAGKPPVAIDLDHKILSLQLKQEVFHSSILTLQLEGGNEQALLRNVQMHPFKPQVLHVDFQRVAQNEAIHTKVPLHFLNQESAPGVKTAGGTVNHIVMELDVICMPKDLPEYIEVDIGELQTNEPLHISQLKLPEGVQSTLLTRGEDPAVVVIIPPKGGDEGAADEEKAS